MIIETIIGCIIGTTIGVIISYFRQKSIIKKRLGNYEKFSQEIDKEHTDKNYAGIEPFLKRNPHIDKYNLWKSLNEKGAEFNNSLEIYVVCFLAAQREHRMAYIIHEFNPFDPNALYQKLLTTHLKKKEFEAYNKELEEYL